MKKCKTIKNCPRNFGGSRDSEFFNIDFTENTNTFDLFVKKTRQIFDTGTTMINNTKKLKREREIQLAVRHQNCLKMYYSCQDSDCQYSIMEKGEYDLLHYLKKITTKEIDKNTTKEIDKNTTKEIDKNQIKIILLGISKGLEYLHSHSIIHRDIKVFLYYYPFLINRVKISF